MSTRLLAAALPAAAAITMALAGPAAAEVCQDCPGGGGGGGGTTVNKKPVASFTVSAATTFRNTSVNVNASASSDPDGSITAYEWEWTGDATPDLTAASGNASWPALGTKTIKLRVKDNKNAWSDEVTKQVSIVNRAPTLTRAFCDEWVQLGSDMSCTAVGAADLDGTIAKVEWDLDGNGTYGDAAGTEITFTPTELKTYRPTARAVDNENGLSDLRTAAGTTWDYGPSSVPFDVGKAVAGKPVTFSAAWGEGEQAGTSTYSREWVFNAADGTRGPEPEGRVATFTFPRPGTYTVKLRQIKDETPWDPRKWTERTQTVVVEAPPKPQPDNPGGGGGQQPEGGGQQPQGGGQQQTPAPQASQVAQAVTSVTPAARSTVATSTAKAKAKKKAAKKCSTKKAKKAKGKGKKAKASAKRKTKKSTCAPAKKKKAKKGKRK